MMSNPCDVNTVRCAVCGKLREQANHWFLIWLNAGFHCYPFELAPPPQPGQNRPGPGTPATPPQPGQDRPGPGTPAPRQPDDRPVCGQACAQKEFERWMTAVRNGELLATSC